MRRAVAGIWWSPATEGTPALVVTAAFFALGGIVGGLLAFQALGDGADAMSAYLEQFLTVAQTGGMEVPLLPELLWRGLRWPAAALLFGFSALGLVGLPVLVSARGFFFAFSVASFARAYGRSGLMVSFLLLGIPGVVAIPAFLLLATQSFSAAWAMAARASGSGRRELPYHREYFFRGGVCVAAIFVSLLLERYLVPGLVAGIAGTLIR